MAKPKKNSKSKAKVKVDDLNAKANPKGGRKAGGGQQEYLVIKMEDILIT